MQLGIVRRKQVGGYFFLISALVCAAAGTAQQPASSSANEAIGGGVLFASNCAGCHGSDGRGGEHAPDIAAAPEVQHLSDAELSRILQKGIPSSGMPAFAWMGEEKVNAVMLYLRGLQGRGKALQLSGDAHRGQLLFTGKAQCSSCHIIDGKGGFIGSDLSLYGGDASPEEIRGIILHPGKGLPPQKKAVTVVTQNGETFTGALRVEDNFSIAVQTADGAFHFFERSELAKVDVGSRSLMPEDYGSTLSSAEVDDLVSYLINTGTERTQASATRERKSDDDDE